MHGVASCPWVNQPRLGLQVEALSLPRTRLARTRGVAA